MKSNIGIAAAAPQSAGSIVGGEAGSAAEAAAADQALGVWNFGLQRQQMVRRNRFAGLRDRKNRRPHVGQRECQAFDLRHC